MILQQLTHGAVARRKARAAVVIHIVNRRGALQKEMTIIPSPCGYDDRAIGNDGAIRVCVGSPCFHLGYCCKCQREDAGH